MHSGSKYYMCRLCDQGFDQIHVLRSHAACHADPVTRMYSCPWCHKTFDNYGTARRHARAFHSQTYTCADCGKTFPRPDKLKLHRLRHSTHREFMCETCGRQFKRKVTLRRLYILADPLSGGWKKGDHGELVMGVYSLSP